MSEYYGNNDYRDYLAHYGVKGMKWRNHKYLKKIGDFYEYNVTGQGYLKDADRYSSRSRAAQARADKASGIKSNSAWNRMYTNRLIQQRNARKARDSYNAYLTKSLSGKLSKNIPASGGWRPVKGGGSNTVYGGYDPNKSKYSNLSEMNTKKKELKKRQRKEKAKALVNKILGKSYTSSPASSQKPILGGEKKIREKKIREKKG